MRRGTPLRAAGLPVQTTRRSMGCTAGTEPPLTASPAVEPLETSTCLYLHAQNEMTHVLTRLQWTLHFLAWAVRTLQNTVVTIYVPPAWTLKEAVSRMYRLLEHWRKLFPKCTACSNTEGSCFPNVPPARTLKEAVSQMYRLLEHWRKLFPKCTACLNTEGSCFPNVPPAQTLKEAVSQMYRLLEHRRKLFPKCTARSNTEGSCFPNVPPAQTLKEAVSQMYRLLKHWSNLTIDSDYFLKQHWPVGVCSGDVICFLWGTNCIFGFQS
jgi:hypothetical protein